ncbi:MAG: NUDIX domain-containing protein [Patescibacteria group bacterium]
MGKTTKEKIKKFARQFSAGGTAFKTSKNGETKWLIVKPAGVDRWQLPKGQIDKGEKAIETALREVKEEGGVETKVIEKIDSSSYFYVFENTKYFKTVTYFLMEIIKKTKEGHDQEIDEVSFQEFDKAYELLTFKGDKNILKKAKELLESST